jgi:hypothetical protein
MLLRHALCSCLAVQFTQSHTFASQSARLFVTRCSRVIRVPHCSVASAFGLEAAAGGGGDGGASQLLLHHNMTIMQW